MGGGTFYYTLPNLRHPIVGKIELGRKRNRRRFLSAFVLLFSFFVLFSFFSGSGGAIPITDGSVLEQLETEGRLEEWEQKSDEAKLQLYNLNKAVSNLDSANSVKIKKYQVKDGDTLSEIATRYRVPATIIAATSKIKYHGVLQPGQELSIPDRPGMIYKVKKGDRLSAIMHKYSVKPEEVRAENPSLDGLDMVEPGENVFLPNAKIPPPALRWVRPVRGRFSSRFGWRRHPILRRRHYHTGVDIAVSYKSVRAARSGRVVYAGRLGSYGKVVVIRHDNRFKSLYAHLSRIKVRSGSYVRQGRLLGVSGNTGRSTGPHLHFEVIRNGRPVNPRRYVRF